MEKALKSIMYRFGIDILKLYWKLKGSRHITAFGDEYKVTPETLFPNHRHLRLPRGSCLSEIVRYTDFVQMHAVCRYVKELTDSPTILDVGAYHGVYGVVIGKIIKARGGTMIAIEPNPEAFRNLMQNVHLNGLEATCLCERIAVMDKPGFSGLKLFGSESFVTTKGGGVDIQVTTLERIMDKHSIKKLDLLMIDVEGAELPVLAGFPWHWTRPGKIFCELHPYAWKEFGYSGSDMEIFLKEHKYRCFDMYLREYESFEDRSYIGPTLFIHYDETEAKRFPAT
jgi:FkbM family methyltransferase